MLPLYRGLAVCFLSGLFCLSSALMTVSAQAANALEPYVLRYLDAKQPVSLMMNERGETRQFSALDLSAGKRLFEENCINCHVGGSTLPNPTVPLSLVALSGATPPRDTIDSLVAFMRQPMIYDNSEDAFLCRQVPES
jgi:photosystem II cytochrome c550